HAGSHWSEPTAFPEESGDGGAKRFAESRSRGRSRSGPVSHGDACSAARSVYRGLRRGSRRARACFQLDGYEAEKVNSRSHQKTMHRLFGRLFSGELSGGIQGPDLTAMYGLTIERPFALDDHQQTGGYRSRRHTLDAKIRARKRQRDPASM